LKWVFLEFPGSLYFSLETTVRTTSGYVSSQERRTINQQKEVLARWKEHFEERLNEGSESEQPTRSVDLRDEGVDIDLPSREEIEEALKYLKNNMAIVADSIATELLKNAGPNLMDALYAVIQQAWTSVTLPRSWNEGVLCPLYKKGYKIDCKNYRGICLLNVTYKVFAKILYDSLLLHANAAIDNRPALCTAPNLRKMQ
jgi:hypothetical protein